MLQYLLDPNSVFPVLGKQFLNEILNMVRITDFILLTIWENDFGGFNFVQEG
jgi:hypothetical protein